MPLVSSKNSFLASGADAATLAVGSGVVFAVIASTDQESLETFTLYDSLAASGDILFQASCHPGAPVSVIRFPANMPAAFSTGLTLDPAGCDVFVIFKV